MPGGGSELESRAGGDSGVRSRPTHAIFIYVLVGDKNICRFFGALTSHVRGKPPSRRVGTGQTASNLRARSVFAPRCCHAAGDLDRDAVRDGGGGLLGAAHGPQLRRLLRCVRPASAAAVPPHRPHPSLSRSPPILPLSRRSAATHLIRARLPPVPCSTQHTTTR